jgi:hypothetical protein
MSNFFYNAYLNYLKLDTFTITTDYKLDTNIQIIGYYDIEKKLWFNAWAMYHETPKDNKRNDLHKKSKDLLTWALNLENDLNGILYTEKTIIRTIICSSKLYITDNFEKTNANYSIQAKDSIQLEILLSVICYLTKAKKYAWGYQNNYATAYIQL